MLLGHYYCKAPRLTLRKGWAIFSTHVSSLLCPTAVINPFAFSVALTFVNSVVRVLSVPLCLVPVWDPNVTTYNVAATYIQ